MDIFSHPQINVSVQAGEHVETCKQSPQIPKQHVVSNAWSHNLKNKYIGFYRKWAVPGNKEVLKNANWQ